MVTIPTIDQISGTTVMNKLRSLIRSYIEFATDVSDEMDYVSEQSQEAYNMASSIDLTNYYTKTEVDNLIAGIDLSDFYTKSEIDATFDNYYTKTQMDDALALKQDVLSVSSPLQIVNNNISIKGWHVHETLNDWDSFVDDNGFVTEDLIIVVNTFNNSTVNNPLCAYIPKGYCAYFKNPNSSQKYYGYIELNGPSLRRGYVINLSQLFSSSTYFDIYQNSTYVESVSSGIVTINYVTLSSINMADKATSYTINSTICVLYRRN